MARIDDMRRAERLFYEGCYQQWLGNGALQVGRQVPTTEITLWARDRAAECTMVWRVIFAPERLGLPLEAEWLID